MKKVSILFFVFFLMSLTSPSGADNNSKQQIIQKTKALYLELIDFKTKSDFHAYGFGAGGPYHDWLKEVEKLEKDPKADLLMEEGIVVGDLKMLGFEYMKSKGKETEYTRFIVPEIKKALNII